MSHGFITLHGGCVRFRLGDFTGSEPVSGGYGPAIGRVMEILLAGGLTSLDLRDEREGTPRYVGSRMIYHPSGAVTPQRVWTHQSPTTQKGGAINEGWYRDCSGNRVKVIRSVTYDPPRWVVWT
jgi:hypothetical protein